MAIVKMKRLRLFGMRSDREALLRRLQKLGCVEIDEAGMDLTDPEWAALTRPDSRGLSRARQSHTLLRTALDVLKEYAPPKGELFRKRPVLSEGALFDDEATVKRLALKGGQVWLMPENENYAPIDGTYAQILGKVAAVVRRY